MSLLNRVTIGPFYQFQNSDDSEESLTKLVLQLCRRIPTLEPDEDVVKTQVQLFKKTVEEVLKKLTTHKKQEERSRLDEGAIAKVVEEMKLLVRDLSVRFEQRMTEGSERYRSRRLRRFHPMLIDEIEHMVSKRSDDPIGILIISSLFRDDFPWLYEIGIETYHTAKSGSYKNTKEALRIFRDVAEFTLRGPFLEEMGLLSKETHMLFRDLPMIIDHYMHRIERPKKKEIDQEKEKVMKEQEGS